MVVAAGPMPQVLQNQESVTCAYLRGDRSIPYPAKRRPAAGEWLTVKGVTENNLKNVNVKLPLRRFVAVTGVSGSGKSTLVHQTLHAALQKAFARDPSELPDSIGAFKQLYGADQIRGVVLLDQSPIGKTSRSNPATYLKAWDEIRKIYAHQTLSLRRGYTPAHFSFNVDGGRCPVCKGEGEVTLDMHFMAELKIPCEECDGKRFKKTILDVSYKGKDIHQLLLCTIDEAYELFRDNTILCRKFGILRDVGLGYLQVGQSATTLSGGEAQRLKIASCLDEREQEKLLYIFDEPTTGLHLDDVKNLLGVLQDLVASGQSVILIEHHLDVIAQADWIIDIGPSGGKHGGRLVAKGKPEDLTDHPVSLTGEYLKKYFDANSMTPQRET
jgi:excinuclease ABC subunit A